MATSVATGAPGSRPASGGVDSLACLFADLVRDYRNATSSLSMVPSENVLSPLARLPFVLDTYSRYFFDHHRKFGAWSFYGGLGAGSVEQEILMPVLAELADAPHLNVQPVSGLSCMMVAMGALAGPGDTIVTMPVAYGGHISTGRVAARLALRPANLPMLDPDTVDLDALGELLRRQHPALVYIDQSTGLFPLDPRPIRDLIDRCSPETLLHYDSSHVNGLILGGALPNPLDRGAHTFGGSTHKTLPGPHKGFLATRHAELAQRIDDMADVFISHHHPAEVVSLAITLLEMRHCGGREYADQVVRNARRIAGRLHERGVTVVAADRGFTGCHQVWMDAQPEGDAVELSDRLFEAGVMVNRVGVPGIAKPALRLSTAELTRLGAGNEEIDILADVLADAILHGTPADVLRPRTSRLRRQLSRPRFCFSPADLDSHVMPARLRNLLEAIVHVVSAQEPSTSDDERHDLDDLTESKGQL